MLFIVDIREQKNDGDDNKDDDDPRVTFSSSKLNSIYYKYFLSMCRIKMRREKEIDFDLMMHGHACRWIFNMIYVRNYLHDPQKWL